VRVSLLVGLVSAWLAVSSAAPAQSRPAPAGSTDRLQARHEIAVLEGVLENAVQYGAQMLNRRLQATSPAPDVVLLSGPARARGFRLDGYGVFFDVEFPALRRSLIWSFRTLDRPDPVVAAAVQDLRRTLQSITDPQVRQMVERTLQLLEGRARPSRAPGEAPGGAIAAASTAAEPVSAGPTSPGAGPQDAGAIYLAEVRNALIGAMLDHAGPIAVAPDEWLTVAARESGDRRLVPGDPEDAALTIVVRLKGSDLAALRAGRLEREDARKRIDAREY